MQVQLDAMQKQMDKYSQSRTQWKQIAEEQQLLLKKGPAAAPSKVEAELRKQINVIQEENKQLKEESSRLVENSSKLRNQICALTRQVSDLKEQIKLNN